MASGKPLRYSCLKNPMNNMKWQKDIAQEDESPRSVGVWYATGEDQRNSSRKNEVAGPKRKRHSLVYVSGYESKF